MKVVSKAALGLALAVSSVSMMAAFPAQAQKDKKEKEAKGPQLKLSKEFRAAMAPVDAAAKANNPAGVLTAAASLDAAATTPDEKYVLNQYRLDAGIKTKDPKAQAQALDGMLATGLVPAADAAKFQFYLGKFAYEANDFAKADTALTAAAAGGYNSTDLYLTQSQLYSKQNKAPQAMASLEKAIAAEKAAGKPVPDEWYKFGISQAYKSKDMAATARWSAMQLAANPTPENWRQALVLYRDGGNLGRKVELDLFRLMRATNSLAGERDYYDYAYVANQDGLPGEAKTAIDLLKAKGSVSNRSINELYTEVSGKVTADKSSLATEEKRAGSAPNGVLAAGTGNAYLGYGEYAKAVPLLQTALTKGGVDADEVNTRLGIALAMSGQKEEAKKVFASVKGARTGIAQFWLTWLNQGAAPAA
ncbi:hypothetical protein [Sphingomonas cavernae]|uniref:Tetratricopeptide repeat protein n=1 Tax=Sphingomonas cavernae TaxID=2320861 RepID=A0A418WMZ2_9SPHN|nr:hypothetical protein [Sphingomonas cavernae]RJF91362.1 hypothetical protein D3876_14775 [Sphingomonas cavernae]